MRVNNNICIIENGDLAVIYDSKVGKKLKISKDVIKILELIKEGKNIDEIKKIYEAPQLEELINVLKKKGFIYTKEHRENNNRNNNAFTEEQIKKGKLLQHLRLNVTEKCNLDCEYCYERESNIYAKKRIMGWDVAKKAIDEFIQVTIENEQQYVTVRFFGGEPLLNFGLVKKCLEYLDKLETNKMKINYILNTNATLITDEIAKVLAKYNVSVAVSLDGTKDVHDSKRKYINGKGSFDIIDNNLIYLVENKCQFNFSVVCTDESYPALKELINYLKEKQDLFKYRMPINFNNIQICDRAGIITMSTEEKVEYLLDVIKYAKEKGIYCYGGLTHFVFDKFSNESVGKHCAGTGMEFSIDPEGDILPCSGLDIKLGDIENFKEVFSTNQYLELVSRSSGNIKECDGCEIEGYCAGGCYAELLSDSGKKSGEYRDCDLQKLLLKSLVKEYILNENI